MSSAEKSNRPLYETSSVIRCLNAPGKDIFAKALKYKDLCNSAKNDGLFACRITCTNREDGMLLARMYTGEEKLVIDAASNDYLNLSRHPAIISAVNQAIDTYGVGAQGAAMLNGMTPIHWQLEDELASFLGKEAVALSASGYGTMTAVISALARSTDVIFYDHYCHPSIEDGITISGAKAYKYPHNDVAALAKLLDMFRSRHRGALIVTDGVCSIDGSVASVEDLVLLGKQYDARLFIDDAHGIGSIGVGGLGCTAGKDVDLIGGVLSKALGSAGGFVAGSSDVIDYIRFFGRSMCSTTNVSVANAAASLAALRILRNEPERIKTLSQKTHLLRQGLFEIGYDVSDSSSSIITLICGSDADAYRAWRRMFDEGVLVHALPFPIVPLGQSRVRLRVNYALSENHIERIISAITLAIPCKRQHQATPRKRETNLNKLGFVTQMVNTTEGPISLHVREGKRPVRLFLHPLLFGSEIYSEIFRCYDSPYAVAAVDWWGHGKTPQTTQTLSLEKMAKNLALIIGIAFTQEEVRVIGTSMGAMIALNCAITGKPRFRSALLIGGSADQEEEQNRRLFNSLLDIAGTIGTGAVIEEVVTAMFSSHFRYEYPLTVYEFAKSLSEKSAFSVQACVKAVLDRSDCSSQLASISCPTTILVGEEDLAEPVGHSERLSESIPNAKLKIVPACGHLVPVEHPMSVLDILYAYDSEDNIERVDQKC